MGFENIAIEGAEFVVDGSGTGVLHVSHPHALVQAAGYLKHVAEPYERVFFRGQRELYGSLKPTVYRHLKGFQKQGKVHNALQARVEEFRSRAQILRNNMPDYAVEPLLQHYGIHTTWVDLVDNVWVALWFSIYRAFSVGKNSEFLHFDRRRPSGSKKYGYLLLIAVEENRKRSPKKGFVLGKKTELIDLRIAAPSVFLRPHAQHGLLFRVRSEEGPRPIDYSSAIRGIIRFDLESAHEWLGDGAAHTIRSLFPPPFFDKGYRILLDCKIPADDKGAISHIGA